MRKNVIALAAVLGVVSLAAAVSLAILKKDAEGVCYGLIDDDAVTEVFESGAVESEQYGSVPVLRQGGAANCEVSISGTGSMRVYFDRATANPGLLIKLDREKSHESSKHVSPIGNGWRGVLNEGDDYMRSAVWLSCSGNAGDSLAISVVAYSPFKFGTAQGSERRDIARVTTSIAEAAGSEWGCEKGFGQEVNAVPSGFSAQEFSSGMRSRGTCQGIEPLGYGTAETPHAPIEDCVVVDEKGDAQFRLSAYYGPFAQAARSETFHVNEYTGERSGGSRGFYWVSGNCAEEGNALYTVETLDTRDGVSNQEPDVQRAALSAFSKRSAAAHGCSLQ